ncbi:hypothetical protein [Tautonia plasticadhaerens]|uniref:Uncharacterized protein n=1 Tax=Tautonia plasticadhaerens TaxID=2527974 RepID=A0A518GYB9_9BACT|nr:hypothetical protein [Tautonia plasticadhaerens]QDV33590.1 hypothetical protein ElP_14640 [Tautonia plasticadhaerens]
MNRETRRQATRNRPDRVQPKLKLETLESRQLLSGGAAQDYDDLIPSLLYRRVEHDYPPVQRAHPIGDSPFAQTLLDNDGKILTGRLPNGTEYSFTVHGPGVVIVTDVTPNDGLLDSEIDTIQLVGTDLNRTYVTAQTNSGSTTFNDGLVGFNRLIAADGVASIILNGFVLRETGEIPTGTPRIELLGGVRTLNFNAIETFSDPVLDQPVDLIIGDPSTPLRARPSIRIDRIFNTSVDGSTGALPGVPQTTPTVRFLVNGQIQDLELGSVTANPVPSFIDAQISPLSYTGRTAIQAFGVDGMKVVGSARNLTLSRTGQPFVNRFSGMDRVGHAYFGGNADAVAIDATNGQIGRLKFLRGLGNPVGSSGSLLEAGIPLGERGYPSAGLLGGVIAARRIGRSEFGPANLVRQIPPDPAAVQLRGPGTINYVTRPGAATTNVTIAADDSIGDTNVVGDHRNSLIAAGYDYIAFRQGLDPVRQPSRVGRYSQRGDLVDSVIASSYRSVDGVYGNGNDLAGNGTIVGRLRGNLYLSPSDDIDATPDGTPLVRGAGFFARRLAGYLPSVGGLQAQAPRRVDSVLVRL